VLFSGGEQRAGTEEQAEWSDQEAAGKHAEPPKTAKAKARRDNLEQILGFGPEGDQTANTLTASQPLILRSGASK
jgi:predicted flap endonuclease-1-like 5' DNA nuclease